MAQTSQAGWVGWFSPLIWELRHWQSQQGFLQHPWIPEQFLPLATPAQNCSSFQLKQSWTPTCVHYFLASPYIRLANSQTSLNDGPTAENGPLLMKQMANWLNPVTPEQLEPALLTCQAETPVPELPTCCLRLKDISVRRRRMAGVRTSLCHLRNSLACGCWVLGAVGWTTLLREALCNQGISPEPCSAWSRAGLSLQTGNTVMSDGVFVFYSIPISWNWLKRCFSASHNSMGEGGGCLLLMGSY